MTTIMKWIRNSALVCAFTGPIDPVEFYSNHKYAQRDMPDWIVANYIVQSLAKNFDEWSFKIDPNSYYDFKYSLPNIQSGKAGSRFNEAIAVLSNTKKKINIKININYYLCLGYSSSVYGDRKIDSIQVNGTSIDKECGEFIFQSYDKLKKQREEAKRVANEALANQKLLEKKWNLAEDILGMKRNEFGALVPKEEVK